MVSSRTLYRSKTHIIEGRRKERRVAENYGRKKFKEDPNLGFKAPVYLIRLCTTSPTNLRIEQKTTTKRTGK